MTKEQYAKDLSRFNFLRMMIPGELSRESIPPLATSVAAELAELVEVNARIVEYITAQSQAGERVLMECGHVGKVTFMGRPACPMCLGVDNQALIPCESLPSLTGRKALCRYCDRETDSSLDLPHFEHRPNHGHDTYYCGCKGWD